MDIWTSRYIIKQRTFSVGAQFGNPHGTMSDPDLPPDVDIPPCGKFYSCIPDTEIQGFRLG